MNTSRIAFRSTRAFRLARPLRNAHQKRFDSSAASSTTASGATHGHAALYGGLAGAASALVLGYTFYSFSGIKSAVQTAQTVKSYVDTGKQKLKEAAPEPNEALEWLRKQTYFYASFVPGGKGYVDTAFNDLETVRQKHGGEVDKIVKDTYEELKTVSSKDLSVSTATEAWQVLQKAVARIGELASDSASEIMDNHPQLKDTIGSNVQQLRSLGGQLGPEAEKVVTDTWSQMRNIVATGGVGAASIAKIKQLIQEKTEQVKQLGDKAWSKGVEEIQPYLDRNPQVKELLETNKKDLLSGNISELWSKVKEASQSGDAKSLENYIRSTVDKAKQKSGGLLDGDIASSVEKYINQVLPGGGQSLMPKFNEWKETIEKTDTKGLESLVKQTVSELEQLLGKKLDEAKVILERSRK